MNLWTWLIALSCVVSFVVAFARSKDTFHPVVVLAPMLAFLYVYMPVRLDFEDGFSGFLVDAQVSFAQRINFAGVLALLIGMLFGARKPPVALPAEPMYAETIEKLKRGGFILGGLGVLAYAVSILNVGGFSAAYGSAYGGGWSDSGYVRDGVMLTLPALIFVGILQQRERGWKFWAPLLLFVAPLALQGIFGARRGPTFMAVSGVGIAWYINRRKRPRLLTLAAGGVLLALLLLFLVSNRQAIYVGSEERLDQDVTNYLRPGTGNEFIYGAGALVHYDLTERYMMGARYFAIFFIRPIPRAIWPDKYVWVSNLFGVPDLEKNLGTDAASFEETLGWQGAVGAAPGIVADMFIEFGYLFPVPLLLIGLLYGVAWRRAISQGGVWVVIYCLLVSLSLYLVLQTLEAMAFRFLLTAIPSIVVWRVAHRGVAPGATVPEEAATV